MENRGIQPTQAGHVDGTSIRTERYRYTEWGNKGRRGLELYDYDVDPKETVNIADIPENAELVARLSEQLHAGWQPLCLIDRNKFPFHKRYPGI